ncbi:MAG TPA: prolyl oligopeptidase family serine peptidase [Vicinamibacterales bacterium]|nr:prolyl oligopeptidase family serine peptidase [Vicinamibacterales bacterium]
MMRIVSLAVLLALSAFADTPSPRPGVRAAAPPAAQTAAQPAARPAVQAGFTLEQVMGYAFPSDLVASPNGDWIAWSSVQRGVRNIWIAQGPEFRARMITGEREETGQELANLAFSDDGRYLVWTRGGDHGANWPAEGNLAPNPTGSPEQPKVEIWAAAVDGEPKRLAEGDAPVPSPTGDVVAFERGREIWSVPIDGSRPAARLFFARGDSESPAWSPDGRKLAFVSSRGAHSYIAIFTSAAEPIQYVAPSTSQDSLPRWSPDGTKMAFVRRPGRGGAAQPPLVARAQPWSIWVADVSTGNAKAIWHSPGTLRGSYPRTLGGANIHWMAGDRLAFLSYQDGWPHLYSVPAAGGDPKLLTPGAFMVEYVTPTPDRRFLVYNANAGGAPDDIERRHLFRVAADGTAQGGLTSGEGIEWAPVVTSSGALAYLSSDARRPPMVTVRERLDGGRTIPVDRDLLPSDFPSAQLVVPQHVTFAAPDGATVHAQLFAPPGGAARPAGDAPTRHPAILFVHGGPPRQMLLGWHYMFYYANSYAVNQYLASRGFVVLSVNYRLGIGYGYEFHQPPDGGARGASEYQDVLAGAKYLQARPDVDPSRVGIWGGSYGGYLTALALGRNSDVFAAGVDIHGVHSRVQLPPEPLETAALVNDGVSPEDLERAAKVAWQSSPSAHVQTWRSPVLFIHGDDDRNVRVDQTVDLVQRLRAQGVKYEEIIIPDEIHDFLLYRSWLRINRATAEFFERMFQPKT